MADPSTLFSFIGTTLKLVEFYNHISDVSSENGIFIRLIQRVQQDHDKLLSLLHTPLIASYILQHNQLPYVNRLLTDTRDALASIGKYVEDVRMDEEGRKGGVRLANKIKWVLDNHEKLVTRERHLATCHTSLMAQITILSHVLISSQDAGAVMEVIDRSAPPPSHEESVGRRWVDPEGEESLRGLRRRGKSSIGAREARAGKVGQAEELPAGNSIRRLSTSSRSLSEPGSTLDSSSSLLSPQSLMSGTSISGTSPWSFQMPARRPVPSRKEKQADDVNESRHSTMTSNEEKVGVKSPRITVFSLAASNPNEKPQTGHDSTKKTDHDWLPAFEQHGYVPFMPQGGYILPKPSPATKPIPSHEASQLPMVVACELATSPSSSASLSSDLSEKILVCGPDQTSIGAEKQNRCPASVRIQADVSEKILWEPNPTPQFHRSTTTDKRRRAQMARMEAMYGRD